MSLRLRALELHVPRWVARSAIRRLFEATGSAFGSDPICTDGSDHIALLERYAAFSATSAERALADRTDLDDLSRRMWNNAYALGESLRRRLGVRSREDALRAARIAYRMIGIDVRADPRGDMVVDRCSFAERYSPQVCRVMSSLDAGMVAGLTGGGRLTFSERITEGRPRCLARIAWEGAPGP
ncbi:MAG TPA: hypothetical protein VF028_05615 [Actinomycetota bacterium]|nr:hypothetical protein [Actinomycetota bacterium]